MVCLLSHVYYANLPSCVEGATLKLKRHAVLKKHEAQIEAMYI